MNLPQIILGVAMILVGIFTIIYQIKWFKKGLKDHYGYQLHFMLAGFSVILGGIILIIKSF